MANMTQKAIRFAIERKMEDWLKSVEDEKLRTDAARSIIVTGGCIPSMLLNEKVRDYDVYFTDVDVACRMAKYYVAKFDQAADPGKKRETRVAVDGDRVRVIVGDYGVASESMPDNSDTQPMFPLSHEHAEASFAQRVTQILEDEADGLLAPAKPSNDDEERPRYRPLFLSNNAITLSHGVQLVVRFSGTPEDIHANFDYVHCTCYWTPAEGLVCSAPALLSILTKELRYIGSRFPLCSQIRKRKFLSRGWTINAGQDVKMAFQISALDLTDIRVLEDQLTGVDTAYFAEVIRMLRDHASDDRVSQPYVIELIDRMF